MLGRELNRIEHTQHFVEIAPGAHRVAEHQLDLLVGADYKHCSHSCVGSCGSPVASIPGVGRQHVIELCSLQFGVADHRVVHFVSLGLFNIRDPLAVTAYWVYAQTDNLAISLREIGL